jgi:hypothetical protein
MKFLFKVPIEPKLVFHGKKGFTTVTECEFIVYAEDRQQADETFRAEMPNAIHLAQVTALTQELPTSLEDHRVSGFA